MTTLIEEQQQPPEDSRLNQIVLIPITIFTLFLAVMMYTKKNKKVKLVIDKDELQSRLDAYQPEPLATYKGTYAEPNIPARIMKHNNLCRSDYLCLTDSNEINLLAVNCIKKYGVGSCGPRGFYGTIDIHLDLETRISDFMQMEETILYSYNLSTMSSAIVAYCKKGDMLFCDEKIVVTTGESIVAARASVTYFKHNDVQDLEEKLIAFDQQQSNKKMKSRKFLIIEGIYVRTGQLCPLVELMTLREKYTMRMFLDESVSFGSMGTNGRGITEHFSVDRTDIDLIVGSLEFGIPSIGGFCVGSNFVVEHQRLSGLGYCFSASLPPLHSAIAARILDIFESTPALFTRLHDVSTMVHNRLCEIRGLHVISHALSPKKVFEFEGRDVNLDAFHEKIMEAGFIFNKDEDEVVSFNVHVNMDTEYVDRLMDVIQRCCN